MWSLVIFYSVEGKTAFTTREHSLIVESIHINLMDNKEMMSDHNSSDLAPQRQEMSVENVASSLVPQGQKASDYDNSDPVPPRQNVVPSAENTDSSHQGLEFLFSPLLEEYYNPTHDQAEENNNDQAPNASFQEAEFVNPFCTRNIKEAMADSAWIKAMQDELHQFDRLKVWELVNKPFGKMIIKEEGIDVVETFISELKKLIENCKGKSVETQFNKPSVVRQPNAQRIPKPSVLGKPTPFSNSPEMRSFQTKQSVNKTNVSDGLFKQVTQQNLPQIRKQAVRNTNVIAPGPSRNCPKHVSHQSPREKVGSNDMVHNYYLEKAKKSAQLQKDKEVNGKPSMIDPARLPNTANGCKPKPRNWQASMSSRVSNKDVHLGEHRKQKPFLKFNELQCPTCKKCLYSANHDECVLEYLSRLNPRASAQNKDAKSHKTTKRYMPVEKSSASKKPERQIPTGHRFSNKKTTTVPEKTMTPRSCLSWKPTGRIFKTIGLRWVPTGKIFAFSTNKVDSEPPNGSIVDIPHIHACEQTLGLSAETSARMVSQKMSYIKWCLLKITLQAPFLNVQKTFDRSRSSLGLHGNDVTFRRNSRPQQRTVKFKAGSKSCSSSSQDSYITTRVGITIPPSHSNAEDNRYIYTNTKSENQKISKKILLDMSLGIDNIYVLRNVD
ncbi:hypothetical protein Tco_0552853 [Tanacetum coccineum]